MRCRTGALNCICSRRISPWRLKCAARRLQVGPVDAGQEPDISFKSTLSGILKSLPMFAQGQPAIGAMRISGDVELASLLQNLVKEFDPDWQEPFVKALGPVFGPQAAKFIREGLQQAKTGAGNFMQSGAEYVTEEARVVVSKAELDDFNTQVDKIRQRGDRLQARVDELTERQSLMKSVLRAFKIVRVLSSYGLDEWLYDRASAAGVARTEVAVTDRGRPTGVCERGVRLRLALQQLGPLFVKLGQVLSTRRDLLPADIADELAGLRDQVKPFDSVQARAIIERAFEQAGG